MTTLVLTPAEAAAWLRAQRIRALGRAAACALWLDLGGARTWLQTAADCLRAEVEVRTLAARARMTAAALSAYLEGYAAAGGETRQ